MTNCLISTFQKLALFGPILKFKPFMCFLFSVAAALLAYCSDMTTFTLLAAAAAILYATLSFVNDEFTIFHVVQLVPLMLAMTVTFPIALDALKASPYRCGLEDDSSRCATTEINKIKSAN